MRKRVLGVLCGLLCALCLVSWIRLGPLPYGLLDPRDRVSTEIVDRGGEPLYEALSASGARARWLRPEELPETLVAATLAAEDKRFYRHPGIDPLAITRAAWHALRARRLTEGGSTITQQAVKLLTDRPRTVRGKMAEIVLALRLEHRLSKREILAVYLSVAPYGNQYVGAEAASGGYFGVPAAHLTPAQAAFLAGLPQRPTAFNPYRRFPEAQRRQQWVLSRMEAAGLISSAEASRAREEKLALVRHPRASLAPHFVERALAGFPSPPRRVDTTLDAGLQADVRGILEMHRPRLQEHGAFNAAVAVLDNASSEWLAWEGSGDYFDAEHGGAIDGVVSPRQPGSALKPFTYGAAFEQGLTPATVLPDIPSHFPTAVDGVLYSPRNYDGVFRGPLRARAALAGSENVPAVWTLSRVGVPALLRLLRRSGLSTLDKTADHYGFALTMGDAEVRLDELVSAYAMLARGGAYQAPTLVRAFVTADGRRLEWPRSPGERVLSERAAFWVADVLSDSRARVYVFGTGGSLDFPFPVAVKTGTSQAYRDNWTIGFTREVTVGVWVGNFDRAPLWSSSGVTGAAPIFHDVMMAARQRVPVGPSSPGDPVVERPAELVPRRVCALSGLAAGEACPVVEAEWLPSDRRLFACSWHRRLGPRTTVSWPATYRAWARERGLLEPAAQPAKRLSEVERRANRSMPAAGLHIVNPPAGATYLYDPTLRREYQTLPLKALAQGGARLTWHVDGHAVGAAGADSPLDWPLSPGRHEISVSDERGLRDETTILVK